MNRIIRGVSRVLAFLVPSVIMLSTRCDFMYLERVSVKKDDLTNI